MLYVTNVAYPNEESVALKEHTTDMSSSYMKQTADDSQFKKSKNNSTVGGGGHQNAPKTLGASQTQRIS
jgi:hypothetical protein